MESSITLASRPPTGAPVTVDNFNVCSQTLGTLAQGQLRVKVVCLSVDPYMRCRFNEDTGAEYMKSFELGGPILSGGTAIVLESLNELFKKGDIIVSSMHMPWMTQAIIDPAHDFVKLTNPLIDKELAPLLNIAGISAYHAVVNHCKPKAGELVVVSSCAGAVGSIAGQLLTQAGARVIGICGSKQKGQWAKSIGAVDVALCYRDNDFEQQLEDACSAKVNLYLDNVGGEISNAVIMQLAPQARVVVCGQISTYNQDTTSKDYVYPDPLPENVATFLETQNATRERFFVGWHAENNDRAYADLHALMSSGKLHVPITWIEGLPSAPQAFCDMMQGKHKGKVMVKLLST